MGLGLGTGMFNGFGDFVVDDMGLGHFPSEQAQLLSLESPPNQLQNGGGIAGGGAPFGFNGGNNLPRPTTGPSPSQTSDPGGTGGVGNSRQDGGNGNGMGRRSYSGMGMGMGTVEERREPHLEDVASWTNISHFLSLFLQYLYPILPLVHRPTFASNLATRLDLRDTDFRALLLSIGEF